jgi:hypothetical protein
MKVQSYYSQLVPQVSKILITNPLKINERSHVIRESIDKISKDWHNCLKALVLRDCMVKEWISFHEKRIKIGKLENNSNSSNNNSKTSSPSLTHLDQHWLEEKYQKNVCGELISIALKATSDTQGLTQKIMTDVVLSLYLCLSKMATELLDRSLRQAEIDFLLSQLFYVMTDISFEWYETCTLLDKTRKEKISTSTSTPTLKIIPSVITGDNTLSFQDKRALLANKLVVNQPTIKVHRD